MASARPTARRHALPVPNGWFAVAVASEIPPGRVEIVRYFDTELVVFRTESGEVAVFDAYCPHLGAHLGHGGKVDGERLRCPFHGWGFGTSGACEDIPYAKRIPPNADAARTRAKRIAKPRIPMPPSGRRAGALRTSL